VQKCSPSRPGQYRTDHGGLASKFFSVNDAFIIDIEAKKMGPVLTLSIEDVEAMRAEGGVEEGSS
jgi:uncharacterized protein YfdQ (DUF2303 family)